MVYPVQYVSRSVNGVPVEPPVIGDLTGRRYWTIADALAGEGPASDLISGLVPQAGTSAGILVGPVTLSATDDFYNGYIVVNTDTTPSNGLVCRYATVINYVGATQTLTLDQPWDFIAESTFSLISPIRISLEEDLTEDILSTTLPSGTGLVLNLQGHRLDGYINGNQIGYLKVNGGSGEIGKGFDADGSGSVGVFIFEDATIEPTEIGGPSTMQGYAIGLAGSGVNVGRCVVKNCRINGRVASRRGYIGWEWINSIPLSTDDVPVRFVEALAGSTVTLVALDAEIDSTWAGSFLYSDGAAASITNATAYVSAIGNGRSGGIPDFSGNTFPTRRLGFARCVGAGAITVTFTTGAINLEFGTSDPNWLNNDFANVNVNTWSWLTLEDYTAATTTLTFNLASHVSLSSPTFSVVSVITVEGASDTTGSATVSGTSVLFHLGSDGNFRGINLKGRVAGTSALLVSCTVFAVSFRNNSCIRIAKLQDAGTPSVTWSGLTSFANANSTSPFIFLTSVGASVGTWTISSSSFFVRTAAGYVCQLPATVSGGTWNLSAPITGELHVVSSTLTLADHLGTGGTLTVSGVQNFQGGRCSRLDLVRSTGAGGTAVLSGSVTIRDATITTASTLVNATTATSTARFTSTLALFNVWSTVAVTMLNATAVGGIAEGPTSITMSFCQFDLTLLDASGSGTLTWTAATLRFRHCHVEGLFTFVGTRFSTIESFNTTWNGNSSNQSIAASGTRPITYRHWRPVFRARYQDLLPEVIRDHSVLRNSVALAKGNLATTSVAASVVRAVAQTAAGILNGVILIATGGTADEAAIIVKDGEIFVDVDGTVLSGDYLVVDSAGTPTDGIAGSPTPGSNIGVALEDAGNTVAGEAYTSVRVN